MFTLYSAMEFAPSTQIVGVKSIKKKVKEQVLPQVQPYIVSRRSTSVGQSTQPTTKTKHSPVRVTAAKNQRILFNIPNNSFSKRLRRSIKHDEINPENAGYLQRESSSQDNQPDLTESHTGFHYPTLDDLSFTADQESNDLFSYEQRRRTSVPVSRAHKYYKDKNSLIPNKVKTQSQMAIDDFSEIIINLETGHRGLDTDEFSIGQINREFRQHSRRINDIKRKS